MTDSSAPAPEDSTGDETSTGDDRPGDAGPTDGPPPDAGDDAAPTDADPGGGGDAASARGVDHAWVMQTTFVVTMLLGVPVVAGAAALADLPTWGARAEFAVRVGAVVWFLTGLLLYAYARVRDVGGGAARAEAAARGDADPEEN